MSLTGTVDFMRYIVFVADCNILSKILSLFAKRTSVMVAICMYDSRGV